VPLSLTHAIFELEDKQILVVDPTSEEQDVAASLLTVTVMTKPKAETYAQREHIACLFLGPNMS
jgi:exosome complex RNA-binding protein Rrp42 (RNase PH superfamily)